MPVGVLANNNGMEDILHQHILVAIETDATRYHGEQASRPGLLSRARAEQMLAHLSTDLAMLLPNLNQCTLTLAGALFDQTQVLRSGYPVFAAMQVLLQSSYQGQPFHPRLLSLGADEAGRMAMPDLQPDKAIPPGLLQLLPLLASGPPGIVREQIETAEHLFLEKGQVSAHTATALQADFGISVTHARFMTLTDLNAMLRLQLEHFGFLPLWELLNAALNQSTQTLAVNTGKELALEWRDDAVCAQFETFNYWATQGGGRNIPASNMRLARHYEEWTREYRQYLTMLQAYGVAVRQYLPGQAEPLTSSFFIENVDENVRPGAASVTEHSAAELGTVAVSVVDGNNLVNYYPLRAEGLNDLHRAIHEAGLAAGDFAFPGNICYDEKSRRLSAESVPKT
jgi:hypothetical protein